MSSMGQHESPTQCPTPTPWRRLDKSMSPRVGDFAQKIIPHLIIPGGGGGGGGAQSYT